MMDREGKIGMMNKRDHKLNEETPKRKHLYLLQTARGINL